MLKMTLEFLFHDGIKITVDITGNLANDALAVQFGAPFRECRLSFSLSLSRARSKRDFTAEREMPSASAVSWVDSLNIAQYEHDPVLILELI